MRIKICTVIIGRKFIKNLLKSLYLLINSLTIVK